jgi:hypothetical protein
VTAAASAPADGTCAREGCAIAAGGACARGFSDPFDCEDFEPYEAEEDSAAAGSDADQDVPAGSGPLDTRGRRPWRQAEESEPLHSGRALTLEEATQVRRARLTAVVVPIGEVSIGKTTLLAALFEALGAAAVGGWSFAGSLSLMGFEERSHLAMVASGRRKSDTPRTSRNTSEVLLHLALLGPDGARQDVLLADVSGEHAEGLRLHNDAGDYTRLLSAATCVLLMVDGKQLAAPAKRHAELTRARTLFQAIHQNELLPDGVPVLLVATKWDLCSEVESEVTPLLEKLVGRIREEGVASDILRVSARPPTSEAAKGSDPFDALLERVMVLPARPSRQEGPRTPVLRPSHAFVPGSAVLRKYVTAAP